MCCAFLCVILPHCSLFRENEVVIFVLFPTSASDTDASDDLKVISREFVKVLHVLNSSNFKLDSAVLFEELR